MLLDSNIIISYLNGDLKAKNFILESKSSGKVLTISVISRAEVLSLPRLTEQEIKIIKQFLEENFLIIPFDNKIADMTAEIRRKYKVKLPDAGIAATAILYNLPLVTLNIQDFKRIKELTLLSL